VVGPVTKQSVKGEKEKGEEGRGEGRTHATRTSPRGGTGLQAIRVVHATTPPSIFAA
jgi:hypothetical protein